jgi:linoleate 10R-lipoxygenase
MPSSTHTALFSQVAAILNKDLPPIEQLSQSLPSIVNALKHPEAIDDHLLLLENLLTLMSELGQNDAPAENQRISMQLQKVAIDFLYKDLPHPPSSYLALPPPSKPKSAQAPTSSGSSYDPAGTPTSNGSSYDPAGTPTSYQEGLYVPYAYRSADGSNYNPLIPSLGQAGMPYARSVDGALQTNLKNLPDPALVFDMLLKRPTKKEEDGEDQDGFTPHPGGVSSLFFALADLIIHTIFNTNQSNPTVNDASSYLDLSVLYGSSEKEVQSVRRKDSEGRPDGTGRLYEDVFADGRLLLMTPATCALLVVFSRNHNVRKILCVFPRTYFLFLFLVCCSTHSGDQ